MNILYFEKKGGFNLIIQRIKEKNKLPLIILKLYLRIFMKVF